MKTPLHTLSLALAMLVLTLSAPTKSETILLAPRQILSKYDLALEAIFGMGVRLQALLEADNSETTSKNFVVSPISATTLIAQMMLGAEGKFREDLYELLSLPKVSNPIYNIFTYNKDRNSSSGILPYAHFHLQLSSLVKSLEKKKADQLFTLKQKNAVFYDKDVILRSEFRRNLEKFYNTDIFRIDFANDSASIINNWANENTNGLISEVFPTNPSPLTISLFLNAIYFLAEWETPFSDILNVNGLFQIAEEKSVNVTYMQGMLEQITYGESEKYRLISLPYKNRELGMFIILPNDENVDRYHIRKFAEKLNPKEVFNTINNSKLRDVVIKMPKLTLSNSFSILKPLQKYAQYQKQVEKKPVVAGDVLEELENAVEKYKNFTQPITSSIYLDGAAENVKFRVSDIRQQIVFSVNEKGTEAAAVSLATFDYIGGQKIFVLNRPFVFFIRHEETLATLFWGTISDPSSN